MKTRILALAVLSLLAAPAAKAAVYYNTLDVPAADQDYLRDGGNGSAASNVAASFALPAGFTMPAGGNLTVTMALSAQSDSQTFSVYILPVAADLSIPDISTGSLVYTGVDSSLANSGDTPIAVTFAITASQLAASTTGNYWIDLVTNASDPTIPGSVVWLLNDGVGSGINDQYIYDDGSLLSGAVTGNLPTYLAPEMIVQDPEPASIGVIGVGLAALGYVRRRRGAKLV